MRLLDESSVRAGVKYARFLRFLISKDSRANVGKRRTLVKKYVFIVLKKANTNEFVLYNTNDEMFIVKMKLFFGNKTVQKYFNAYFI